MLQLGFHCCEVEVSNRTRAWAYACCMPWYMLSSFWLRASSNSGIWSMLQKRERKEMRERETCFPIR